MQFRNNNARPVVLRELSLLRALGASLRTSNRPGRLRRLSLPFTTLSKPDSVSLQAHPLASPPTIVSGK